jgi:peptidoglycan/xylan/chitin deacetylase (PgdA/CDA1 family)
MYHFTIDLELYDPIKKDKKHFEQYVDDTKKIIDYIFDKLNKKKIKITCFLTNEFVDNFYEKCEEKIFPYHEISCHTSTHCYYNRKNKKQFFDSIKENKSYLEKIIGKNCYGFRAPSCMIPKDLGSFLIKLGFKYDSSVVPGIIPGRQYKLLSPKHPYYPDKNNIFKKSDNQDKLIEFPLAVLPVFNISANGFLYPYLFYPYQKYFYNNNTTTYVHLVNFYNVFGKNYLRDYFKNKYVSLRFFNNIIEKYKNCDLSHQKMLPTIKSEASYSLTIPKTTQIKEITAQIFEF